MGCPYEDVIHQPCIFSFNMFVLTDKEINWNNQRGNQKPQIKEQTTQWSKENGQKEKQRYTKHYTEN
jgi:hypothetical protein